MADQFKAALPEGQVTVKSPLTIGVRARATSDEFQVNLDRMWGFCVRNSMQCAQATAVFVNGTAETLKQMPVTIDASMIRVAIRPATYIEGVRKQFKGDPKDEPIGAPVAGDLWWILVADAPRTARILKVGDLNELKITMEQAIEIGRRNTASSLRPLDIVTRDLPANGIGTIEGSYYESSRLALHDDWAAVASRMSGPLIVAVPGPGLLFYADGGRPHALDALSTLASAAAAKQERPLSATVFKWTREGWQPLTP
jgi:hypothetical protein